MYVEGSKEKLESIKTTWYYYLSLITSNYENVGGMHDKLSLLPPQWVTCPAQNSEKLKEETQRGLGNC